MEKICKFCLASRPVVHCKADAAHLCLSCDAKIHSANAIVNRHHRTVLCDSCNYLSAFVQCLDHNDHRIRLMCHFCDQSQHEISSSRLHPKRQFSGYTGCPSAEQFAAMWGFQLNDEITLSITSSYYVEHLNALGHQILHLKRLQLTDQETSINIDSNSVHQLIYGQEETSHQLSSNTSSTVGVPLHAESIWQWTSPVQSTSQVDSQNVQDQIQVCKKLACPDDSNLSNAECLAVLNFELGLLVDDDDVDDDNNHDDVPLSYASYASSTMDESRADASIHINGSSSSSTSSWVFCTIPSNVSSCGLKGEEHLEARAKAMIRYKEKKRSRSHAKTIRYPNRKARADVRKRVNGRFV